MRDTVDKIIPGAELFSIRGNKAIEFVYAYRNKWLDVEVAGERTTVRFDGKVVGVANDELELEELLKLCKKS